MTQRIKNEKYFDGETMDDDKMNEMGFKELTFQPMVCKTSDWHEETCDQVDKQARAGLLIKH